MEIFRICIVGSFGSKIEEQPFKSRDEANKYARDKTKAIDGVSYGVVGLGEAVNLKVEVTDTFSGEPNFSWVNRHEQWIPRRASVRHRIRVAKKLAGWTGIHCEKSIFDDGYTLKPRGLNQVMFINFDYDTEIT